MRYFYDRRTDELVSEDMINVEIMSPKTYYEYADSNSNWKIIETWCVYKDEQKYFLDVTYDEIGMFDKEVIRESIFKRENAYPIFLAKYSVPTQYFKKNIENL